MSAKKKIKPVGDCTRFQDCIPFLRQNLPGMLTATVTDGLNKDRDARKQFYQLIGAAEYFAQAFWADPSEDKPAFVSTKFEQALLQRLRRLTAPKSKRNA